MDELFKKLYKKSANSFYELLSNNLKRNIGEKDTIKYLMMQF